MRTDAEPSKRGTPARLPGFAALAVLVGVVVLVPVALNTDVLLSDPQRAYYPAKFAVLMVCAGALLAAVASHVLVAGRPFIVPVLIPALAFVGVATLSALFSGDFRHSLLGDRYDGLLSLAGGVLVFYAAAFFLDTLTRVRVFLAALVTAAVGVAVFGIMQNFGFDMLSGWPLRPFSEVGRPPSTVGNPISLSAYLALAMGAAAAAYYTARSRAGRAWCLAALFVMGACGFYTYTRGALLSAVVVLILVPWLARRRMGTLRLLLVPLAVLVASVTVAAATDAARPGGDGGGSFSERARGEGAATSVTARLYIWRDTVPVILERPVLGHGPDNFREPFARHEGADLKALSDSYWDKAHNELLQVAATTGLLGLAAYLWVIVAFFRNALRRGGWATLALATGVLAYLVQLQTYFTSATTGVIFWSTLGACVALTRVGDEAPPDAAAPSPTRGEKAVPLVVVAVAVVLAALAVPTFLAQRAKAQDSYARSTLLIASFAQRQFFAENGTYATRTGPGGLADVGFEDPDEAPVTVVGADDDSYCMKSSGGARTLYADKGRGKVGARPCAGTGTP